MRINKDTITRVELNDAKVDHWFTWKSRIRLFGITLRQEGFYDYWNDRCEIHKETHFIKDKNVWLHSSVTIYLADGSYSTRYFISPAQARLFFKQITDNGKFIETCTL